MVPAGPLWALPWEALRLADDRTLLEAAAFALTPALCVQTALARREVPSVIPGVLVSGGDNADLDGGVELETLRTLYGPDLERVNPHALTARLTDGPPRANLVITAVPPQAPETAAVGLDHHVDLGGGIRLRAADLVSAHLAGVVTLGTCFVASPITRSGEEPLTLNKRSDWVGLANRMIAPGPSGFV